MTNQCKIVIKINNKTKTSKKNNKKTFSLNTKFQKNGCTIRLNGLFQSKNRKKLYTNFLNNQKFFIWTGQGGVQQESIMKAVEVTQKDSIYNFTFRTKSGSKTVLSLAKSKNSNKLVCDKKCNQGPNNCKNKYIKVYCRKNQKPMCGPGLIGSSSVEPIPISTTLPGSSGAILNTLPLPSSESTTPPGPSGSIIIGSSGLTLPVSMIEGR